MKFETINQPEATALKVYLEPNESLVAEPGAMISMSTNIKLESKTAHGKDAEEKGGAMSKFAKLGKRMLAGESLFKTKFTAENGPGEVVVAQTMPGDIKVVEMPAEGLYLNNGAFIASSLDVKVEGAFGGLKSFIGANSLVIIHATPLAPNQHIMFGAYGALQEVICDGSIVIDNEHLVAWETTLNYNATKATEGLVASYLSGEGFVCSFTGHGKIWVQTRNATGAGQLIASLLSS